MKEPMIDRKFIPLIRLSAVGFWSQLAMLGLGMIIMVAFGPPPTNAVEAFARFQENRIGTLLADDTYNVIIILLYIIAFPGLFIAVKDYRFTTALLATIVVIGAALTSPAGHTAFSLMRLSDLYGEVGNPVLQERLLAAGEALIAGNLWNSSIGYTAGIFLQGGTVLMCFAMAGNPRFRKATVISGIAGNGLDLVQHLIHPFLPGAAEVMKYVMGPFYILWFVMVALDMGKLYRKTAKI